MGLFAPIIDDLFAILEERDKCIDRMIAKEREEKERKGAEKREREYAIWKQVTAEERENPEEFRVLPYGWSPFGIRL